MFAQETADRHVDARAKVVRTFRKIISFDVGATLGKGLRQLLGLRDRHLSILLAMQD